jgi:WD40 repeat protein
VRFSPDGTHIMIQDEAGVYVLARQPLNLTLSITGPRALAARFSADSKSLIVTTNSLNVARYDLTLSWKISETAPLAVPACLAAELSDDGELAACYDTELRLRILRTTTGEEIFSDRFKSPPPRHTPIPVPRSRDTAFAEPFGYFYAAAMKGWIGRRDFAFSMTFSPDNRFLLARDSNGDAIAVDVSSRKKIGIPRSLNRNLDKAWCFVDPTRIFVLESNKQRESELFSFPGGELIGRLPATGAAAVAMSEQRYLRVDSPFAETSTVFDLGSNKFVENLRAGQTDILRDFVVTYSNDGEVSIYKIGESQSFERQLLPLDSLPQLRVASVSPDLANLAISFRGAGAIYRIATGERIASYPNIGGAWFSSDEMAYLRSRLPDNSPAPVQKLDLRSNKVIHTWSEPESFVPDRVRDDIHAGGSILLVDSPVVLSPGSGDVGLQMRSTEAYELRALDMEKGTRLWARAFATDVPVPFADPQGNRVVLGWVATTEAARVESKRVLHGTRRSEIVNHSEHDTFFEVLNARDGKVLGGVITQIGAGPEEFESVFSVGDALILFKDDLRITIFSLSKGLQIARFFGSVLAASGESNLLAVSDRKSLKLYDLETGAKRDEYAFPDDMAYLHFSVDGKRLLAITAHQMAYVLDIAGASIERRRL